MSGPLRLFGQVSGLPITSQSVRTHSLLLVDDRALGHADAVDGQWSPVRQGTPAPQRVDGAADAVFMDRPAARLRPRDAFRLLGVPRFVGADGVEVRCL